MGKKTIYVILSFLMMYVSALSAQDSSYVAYEDDYYKLEVLVLKDTICIGDTIYVSHLNDITRLFNKTFDEYTKQMLDSVNRNDSNEVHSLERLYLNYFLPMYYPTYIQHRYIVQNYSVEVIDDYLKIGIDNLRMPPSSYRDSVAMDIMLMCRGDVNTDNFLRSDYYRSSCLEQLFLFINRTKSVNIKGINLYFPDFSFKEKRAMAQFVKSASLVIDSCNVESIRKLKLYATFDKNIGNDNIDYLYGLTQMADSILLVDSRSEDWTRQSIDILCKEKAKKMPWWSKVVNQIYLAHFTLEPFPEIDKNEELSPQNIRKLIRADYPYNNWEIYLFALIGIILIIGIVAVLYRFKPRFSYFLNNNMSYFFSLVIMLILEIYLLFICMVEAMSNEDVFTFGGEDKNTFLLLPLLFIFIIPMLNIIAKKREKP